MDPYTIEEPQQLVYCSFSLFRSIFSSEFEILFGPGLFLLM